MQSDLSCTSCFLCLFQFLEIPYLSFHTCGFHTSLRQLSVNIVGFVYIDIHIQPNISVETHNQSIFIIYI